MVGREILSFVLWTDTDACKELTQYLQIGAAMAKAVG